MSSFRIPPRPAALIAVALAAGGLCWLGAKAAVTYVETRSAQSVRLALDAAGQDWVQVEASGLQLRLGGLAPSEAEHFRAMRLAATMVDPGRLVDEMSVVSAKALTPPDFRVELLRNDEGVSLIGLVPAGTDRSALTQMLANGTGVTDLLETADYPVPATWNAALTYGLEIAQRTAHARISISATQVEVAALAESAAQKGALEAALRRLLPAGVELVSQVSAPRPVITPFTMRFVIDDTGPHFDACTADNETGRDRILQAALRAGVSGQPDCTLALGAPTANWADAAVAAIQAVAALGQGSVTISDAEAVLIAPSQIERATFDEVTAGLDEALPGVFSLQARLEQAPDATAGAGPLQFQATVQPGGGLTMGGQIADPRMREAVEAIAGARFPQIRSSLRSDERAPEGWTLRVIAGLEAAAVLDHGKIRVTPDLVEITGVSGDLRATDRAASLLAGRLGAGAAYDLSIRYDRRLDAALGLPDGAECVDQLNIVMSESEIGFEPSKSDIAGDPAPTLNQLAAIMTECSVFAIEAGGHTDSQGSEAFNAELSRSRAQALVSAMGEAGIDISNLSARGYGESQPVASNETEAGREANRRIAFLLLAAQPASSMPLPEPVTMTGITSDAMPEPAPAKPPETPGPAATPEPATLTPELAPLLPALPPSFAADADGEAVQVQIADDTTPRPIARPAPPPDRDQSQDQDGAPPAQDDSPAP